MSSSLPVSSVFNGIPQVTTAWEIAAGKVGHQIVSSKVKIPAFIASFLSVPLGVFYFGDKTFIFSEIGSMFDSYTKLVHGAPIGPSVEELTARGDYEAAFHQSVDNLLDGGPRKLEKIDNSQAIQEIKNLIKGAIKITSFAMVTFSFYSLLESVVMLLLFKSCGNFNNPKKSS